MTEKTLSEIENLLKYRFKNTRLASTAFTHASFGNETKSRNYEKLELLGDSVLNLAVTQYLVANFPDKTEGELSKIRAKIVSTDSLANATQSLGLEKFILLGKSELNGNKSNKKKLHSDIFEALTGAIFLDGGFDSAVDFVVLTLKEKINSTACSDMLSDFKTALQEVVQKQTKNKPEYRLVSRTGPDHCPVFCYDVVVDGEIYGNGCAASKTEAQLKAAQSAYLKIKETFNSTV